MDCLPKQGTENSAKLEAKIKISDFQRRAESLCFAWDERWSSGHYETSLDLLVVLIRQI